MGSSPCCHAHMQESLISRPRDERACQELLLAERAPDPQRLTMSDSQLRRPEASWWVYHVQSEDKGPQEPWQQVSSHGIGPPSEKSESISLWPMVGLQWGCVSGSCVVVYVVEKRRGIFVCLPSRRKARQQACWSCPSTTRDAPAGIFWSLH